MHNFRSHVPTVLHHTLVAARQVQTGRVYIRMSGSRGRESRRHGHGGRRGGRRITTVEWRGRKNTVQR